MKIKIFLMLVLSLPAAANMCLKGDVSLENVIANSVQQMEFGKVIAKTTDDAVVRWNALKAENNCAQGRLADKTFALNGDIMTYNGLSGWLSENQLIAGELDSYSYGKSYNGDLIFIQQVKTDEGLKANVVISMCQYSDGLIDFITPTAKMDQFFLSQIQLGSCVDEEKCKEKELLTGQFGFYSEPLGDYVPTTVVGIKF